MASCCCGLFHKKKHNKKSNKDSHNAQNFAPRPVQQVVQDGRVSYQPTSQQQRYGGGGQQYVNDKYASEMAANKAMAQGAFGMVSQGMNLNPKVQKYGQVAVGKGVEKAMEHRAKQQAQQAQQYGGSY